MEQAQEGIQSKENSKKRVILFFVFFLLIIGCGIWYGLSIISGPLSSEVKQGDTKYSLDAPNLPPAIKQFKGEYFSLYFSEKYEEKRHIIFEKRESPILEQSFFTQLSAPGRKVAITIEQTDDGQIENLSSYTFRMMNPKIYQKDVYEWDKKQILIFSKSDPVYEIVGYIKKSDKVATVAISSSIELPEKLMSDFSDILKSFRWTDGEASNEN